MTDGVTSNSSEAAREISREMVALVKTYMGRGPKNAKTYLHDDLVVVVLHDVLTHAERSLAEAEKADLVEEIRRTFKETVSDSAIAAVERQLGRRVVSFLSDQDVENDCAVKIFVLGESPAK